MSTLVLIAVCKILLLIFGTMNFELAANIFQ